ncbi:MAG: hypothetical protein Q7J14_01660 [Candidatus Magasanikbacteria bacterium]|nr:hypothetical protein [Candidatus Magasanikbacteria bacterium]
MFIFLNKVVDYLFFLCYNKKNKNTMNLDKNNDFGHLFWYFDNKKNSPKKDKNILIHQVLSHGSFEDIKKLFKIFNIRTIRNEFIKPKAGLYSPSVFELACYLLKVKNINKNKYLKNIYDSLGNTRGQ